MMQLMMVMKVSNMVTEESLKQVIDDPDAE